MFAARSLLGLLFGLSLIAGAGVPLHAQSRLTLQLPPPRAEAAPDPAPAPAALPPSPVAFDAALQKAANDLLSRPDLDPDRIDIVIDPLIDGVTGAQSNATHLEERRIVELIRSRYPRFRILPFTVDTI